MPALLTASANDILNRTALEMGLEEVNDPWSSAEKHFQQMRSLLNVAGEELTQNYPWAFLVKEHTFTTTTDTEYALPTDFLYLIDQTGWERGQSVPLMGPLSPQQWQVLKGRDLDTGTLYASFRVSEGVFKMLPDPMTAGKDIAFEYMSRNWVLDSTTGTTYKDKVEDGADTPQFDRTLMSRYLKVKFLEMKGFDTTKAQADLNHMFQLITGHDKGAPILSVSSRGRGHPYLDPVRSLPDTGYGT